MDSLEEQKFNPYNKLNKFVTEEFVNNILSEYGVEEKLNDLSDYQSAFVHKSYINKDFNLNNNGTEVEMEVKPEDCMDLQDRSYETLEFLGDSIVGATVTNYVYDRFPDEEEGFMTKMKTKLVCGEMLGSLGLKMGLNEYLIISKHVEEKCNGRNSVKTMEDVFEAFIGAMYLDFNEIEIPGKMDFYSGIGFQTCQLFIINVIEKFVDFSDLILNDYNYKDQLLRYFQQKYKCCPKYREISVEGPSHDRQFTVCVVLNDESIVAYGREKSKKKAEQLASRNALIKFGVIEE
jgi:ribonuclease-3